MASRGGVAPNSEDGYGRGLYTKVPKARFELSDVHFCVVMGVSLSGNHQA